MVAAVLQTVQRFKRCPAQPCVADWRAVGHSRQMESEPDGFEESARIVESFAEGETDPRVLDMLVELAKAIRDRAVSD